MINSWGILKDRFGLTLMFGPVDDQLNIRTNFIDAYDLRMGLIVEFKWFN